MQAFAAGAATRASLRVRPSPERGGDDRAPAARALLGAPDPEGLSALQRLAGNRAVSHLVVQRQGVGPAAADAGGGIGGLFAKAGAALAKAISPKLKNGDSGPAVEVLQKELNDRGAALITDGKFGAQTKAAVNAIQRDSGLKPTGVVDEATWSAIRAGGSAKTSTAPGLSHDKSWRALSAQERKDWTTLGYTAASWKAKEPSIIVLLPYVLLSDDQRAAATRLGFTRESWRANRDATAATAGKAFGDEEKAAKRKAGAGVLPAKYVGSLRAKAILSAEYGDYAKIELAKVHLLSAGEMKTTWEGIYGVGTYHAVNGFTVKPDIYLNKSSVWSGTSVHESLHVQEHTNWDAFAYSPTTSIGEGATTILTELAMTKHGRAVEQHPYPTQVSLVTKMNKHAGLDKLKAAYFEGKTADYQTAVTAGLVAGATWAQFRALVDAGTLAAAEAKLK